VVAGQPVLVMRFDDVTPPGANGIRAARKPGRERPQGQAGLDRLLSALGLGRAQA
jgi:hypothetical protein